jgi:hypothetical protein
MRVVRVAAASFLISVAVNGSEPFVPWKVCQPGEAPARAPLILYWIPVSPDDFRHSELLVSRPLAMYATQCVAMQVIRADDRARIEKLAATGKLPVAVLVGGDGQQIARAPNGRGALHVAAVENMVRDELRARESALDAKLDDAGKRADQGDKGSAIALYRSVWEQRCLFPRHARDASRALRKLGVDESDR